MIAGDCGAPVEGALTFAALYHFILLAVFIVYAVVAAGGMLFAIVLVITAKGTLRERIRDNFGGGT